MKLLLDEHLPKKLKCDLPNHEVYHVSDRGWQGKKNGELMRLMLDNEFDGLITMDKNIEFQQNLSQYPLSIFVLKSKRNSYFRLKPYMAVLSDILEEENSLTGVIKVEI